MPWLLAWILTLMWMASQHGGKTGRPVKAAGHQFKRPQKHSCVSLINVCAEHYFKHWHAKSNSSFSHIKVAFMGSDSPLYMQYFQRHSSRRDPFHCILLLIIHNLICPFLTADTLNDCSCVVFLFSPSTADVKKWNVWF